MKTYSVYVMANGFGSVLYIGITNNLERRVWEHKSGAADGFTKKYGCRRLVYFEQTNDVIVALNREKELKGWRRSKKIALIRTTNPMWKDLSE